MITLFSLIVLLTLMLNFVGVKTNPDYCSNSLCIETIQGFSMKLDMQYFKSLIVTAFQFVFFVKSPDYLPYTNVGKILVPFISKLFIPLQAALFAFSLRNRFRR